MQPEANIGLNNWMCRIFGHKHVLHGLGWSQLKPYYCIRCFANAVTEKGDGSLWCKIFGHKNRLYIIGDDGDQSWTGNACMNCHAKV